MNTPCSTTHLSQPAAMPLPSLRQDPHRALGEGCDEVLTKEELAAKLKVAVRTIENWQHDGFLPFLKISNVVLFHWPTVLAHLLANFGVAPRGVVRPGA